MPLDSQYTIKVKEFEGPLELLLELIESRKLSVNEVSLGSVTEEYFRHLEKLKDESGLEHHAHMAAFLVVAATLMLIKSRSLLPGFSITDEEAQDIKELEHRLMTYKHIKEFATRLGERDVSRHQLYTREPLVFEKPAFLPPNKKPDFSALLGMLKVLLAAVPQKNELSEKTLKKIVSIEERIREIEERIHKGLKTTFHEFVADKKARTDVILSFLAMLELVKMGSIAVTQSALFDTIHIEHGTSS